VRASVLVLLAVVAPALLGCSSGGKRPTTNGGVETLLSISQTPRASSPRASGSIRRLLAQGLPIYCGGDRPYAALTFDDGPGVYTPLALRILAKAHVPATFFLVGRNVGPYRRLAQAEASRYALGNHTFTHPVLPALPPSAIASQLASTSSVIRRDTGVRVQVFRPPYEAHNAAVDAIAHRQGLLEILWNVDSRDSAGANYADIARYVEAGISPGAIVLMHENRGQTIRALKFTILPALRKRRIKLVTVPQLLALDPPTSAQLRAGRSGCRYHAATTSGA
jgi:peptidoglycan/xylan/chitin deacetylase (PgdA/CDA1 family)